MITAAIIGLVILAVGGGAVIYKQRQDNKAKEQVIQNLRTQLDTGERARAGMENRISGLADAAQALHTRLEATEAQVERLKTRNTELKEKLASQVEENAKLGNIIAEFEEGLIDADEDSVSFSRNRNRVDFLSRRAEGLKDEFQPEIRCKSLHLMGQL